ncbi:hypothetical protein LAJ19_11830 [Deinococcus taeanensis]|uniref:hypothetical protein n=1 Tax=Deinococcus taeanensis TaxID=2737050 RepID=UPI001CDC913C|nr:hypothetical protein [Deinococcus taeanensis]UBV42306.1 hypothetical protein LAJ19_11830 [Deinococcus taeanensis]
MTMTHDEPTQQTTYQVGVFALIHHQDTYLITRPREPLLPGAHGLPGLVLHGASGTNPVELNLRRVIRDQLKLVVSDLKLVASHAARGTHSGRGDARLHLIFGTDYSAGILEPDSAQVTAAEWIPRAELLGPGAAPEWLQGAIREAEVLKEMAEPDAPAPRGRLGFMRRR